MGASTPISSLATDALRAELARRKGGSDSEAAPRPVCGSGKGGVYETGLHVFALFLILAISTLGRCSGDCFRCMRLWASYEHTQN